MSVLDFGVDLWIELIVLNDLSNQDIFNLSLTCKFFSQLLKKEKVIHFVEDRQIHFGKYEIEKSFKATEAVDWSSDSRSIAVGDKEGKIFIWNVKTGKLKKKLEGNNRSVLIQGLRFHPRNANLLAVGDTNGFLCLWNVEKSEIEMNFEGHSRAIYCIAFDPQGRFLASAGQNRSVRVWNVENGKCEQSFNDLNGTVDCVEFTSDGRFLGASSFDSPIFIWDVETFQLVSSVDARISDEDTFYFRFFNDNKTMVVINSLDQKVRFYEFLSGNEKTEMSFVSKLRSNFSLSLHPNQKIVCLSEETFEIWDLQSKKMLKKKNQNFVCNLSFSPNGKALVVVFYEYIHVFDMSKYL